MAEEKYKIVRSDAAKELRRKIAGGFGVKEETVEGLFSRQIDDADPFHEQYQEHQLIAPPYPFFQLYRFMEESDVLRSCVEVMQKNVDGFGFQFKFLGRDQEERESEQSTSEYEKLYAFFSRVNETESITTIRKKMRMDFETLGIGGFEVVRNARGEPQLMYYLPFKNVRMTRLDKTPVNAAVKMPRNGRMVNMRVKRRFRKFVQHIPWGVEKDKYRWFKEFGDPRIMDATTGQYKESKRQCKMVATEILPFKKEFGGLAYGLPRWIGAILDVIGRRQATYVNYDLFQSQGIPPVAVMVSGGQLTDESLEELENLIQSMRGVKNWNRVLVLEATSESFGLDERNTAKIDLKNMADYRKEDLMFQSYLEKTKENIRQSYRLPPIYTGSAETYTHSTARTSQLVAEEQIFIPERQEFDEDMDTKLVKNEFNVEKWSFKSKGPTTVGAEEISKSITSFKDTGALSINNAITLANRAFDLEMNHYKEDWADEPLVLVKTMLEQGYSLDDIARSPTGLGSRIQRPYGEKASIVGKEEEVYVNLVELQKSIDKLLSQEVSNASAQSEAG